MTTAPIRTAATQQAIETAPVGTHGLAIAPWSPDDVYGVASNWGQDSAAVYTYSQAGWVRSGRQVADYRHRPSLALLAELREAMLASGDDDATEAAALVNDADEF